MQLIPGGHDRSSRARPYFPDPDTEDNHIAIDKLGFGLAPHYKPEATGQPDRPWGVIRPPPGSRDRHE